MTREEAINKVRHMSLPKETMGILQALVPELAESEDERARKEIIDFIQWAEDRGSVRNDYHQTKRPAVWIGYLERQKECLADNGKTSASEDERIMKWIKKEIEDKYVVEGIVNNKLADEAFGWLEKQKHLYETTKDRFYREGFEEGQLYEKQKEQEPIKVEVYEVGKGTTVCGQDYKCKKDYKAGNCRYIKDAIYHCGRDGYLTDQNGVSWSCTPEWFNEYIQSNTEWAEEEKTRFVSGQFLQCKLSFDGFKEGERYWLEYIGDDMYVGRSDNILNQKFHITPRQLYTLFSQQLEEKQKEQKPSIFPPGLGKVRWNPISSVEWSYPYGRNETADRLVSLAECLEMDGDCLFNGYSGTECGKFLRELARKEVECKPEEWGEEDEHRRKDAIYFLESAMKHYADTSEIEKTIDWLNSLRSQSKKELSMEKAIRWLDDTFYFLDNSSGRGRDCEITTHDFDSLEEMYDSFRKAVTVDSQPFWKPSEEQMEALKEAADYSFYAGEGATLRILYNDLQKRYGTC